MTVVSWVVCAVGLFCCVMSAVSGRKISIPNGDWNSTIQNKFNAHPRGFSYSGTGIVSMLVGAFL